MSQEKRETCILGKQSIELKNPVYIRESASVVGTKEGQGPLAELFDMIGQDDMFGCDSWEEAESSLQKDAVYLAMGKAELDAREIQYLFAGDLLGQSIATSFGIMTYEIPLFGLYGACSTCGESLSLGSMAIDGGFARNVICVTSSHFASAEKEFRNPLEYGSQRPLSETYANCQKLLRLQKNMVQESWWTMPMLLVFWEHMAEELRNILILKTKLIFTWELFQNPLQVSVAIWLQRKM